MRLPLAVVVLWLALVAPAAAADCAVGEGACPDLQAALDQAAASPGGDVVRLRGEEPRRAGGFAYAGGGGPLELVGAGPDASRVPGPLRLAGAEVALRGATLTMPAEADRAALEASGLATQLRITGAAAPGGRAVEALAGSPLTLHDAVVDATGLEAALDAPCGADLRATHVTVAGAGTVGARAECGILSLRSSIRKYGSRRSG